MKIKLERSKRKNKQLVAIFNDGTKVHFGAKGASTYPIHKDPKIKANWIARHSKLNENWNDITTPATWSKNLLWNKKTLEDSIKDMEKRFNVKITY
jgi:hypothetical protein